MTSLTKSTALSSRIPQHPAAIPWLIPFHIHTQAHNHALFGVFVSIALIFYKNKFLWLSIIKYPNAINNNPSYLHNKYPKLLSSHRNNTAMRQPSRARLRSGCSLTTCKLHLALSEEIRITQYPAISSPQGGMAYRARGGQGWVQVYR